MQKKQMEDDEDEEIDWRHHPAKHFLKKGFRDGAIPCDYSKTIGPRKVWDDHCANNPVFEGMNYNSAFTRRLMGVRDNEISKNSRLADDPKAHKIYCSNHPVATHNQLGEPRWQGSEAQRLLKEDMADGKHERMDPQELHETKEECKEFKLQKFRDHIYQELRLWRFHNFLRLEAEKPKKKRKTNNK